MLSNVILLEKARDFDREQHAESNKEHFVIDVSGRQYKSNLLNSRVNN